MAWKEARQASSALQEYLQECAKAIPSLEGENIATIFIFMKNLFSNIISAKGGTISGQPSLEQYFDALKGATNCFTDEQAAAFKGTVVAAQKAMAQDENVAFTTEQKTALLQIVSGVNEQCKVTFFKGGNWNRGNSNVNYDGCDGTWIAQKMFQTDANKAERLFERYCKENGLILGYKSYGEYPQCKVECYINHQMVATGTGKGPWGAKKWAMKEAYFWCRKNVKDNHGKYKPANSEPQPLFQTSV